LKWGLFSLSGHQWINVALLFAMAGLYLFLFLLSIRYLRLVRKEDIEDLQALDIPKLNKLLHFLVR